MPELGRDGISASLPSDSIPASNFAPSLVQKITILFSSETGNAASLAKSLASLLDGQGTVSTAIDMANYKPQELKAEQNLIIITSTHGEGDPPT